MLTFGGKIMPQIIPIKDLKKHLKKTSEISELCHRAAEPIYITKNGYGDMIFNYKESRKNTAERISREN